MRTPSLAAIVVLLAAIASAQTPGPTPRPTPWAVAGPEFPVNTTTSGNHYFSTVAIGADKGFIVTWTSDGQDGDGGGVFARRFDKTGAPLSGEFQVNTATTGFQYESTIASDPDGNFIIVWVSNPGSGGSDVFARRYDAAGNAVSGEFPVNSYTTGLQRFPDVAMGSDGFIVVWSSASGGGGGNGQDGDQGGVYGQRFSANGVPNGGEFRVNTYTAGYQTVPRVSMSPQGSVVAWQSRDQDGDGLGTYAQRYDAADSPNGGEFRVNTFTTGSQGAPDVAMGYGADFVIAWSSYGTGTSDGVFVRGFNLVGEALGRELQVNNHPTLSQSRPKVAMDETHPGGFVVVWTGLALSGANILSNPHTSPPQDTSIYAQRFNNAAIPTAQFYYLQPPRRGGQFQVNTYTDQTQTDADVAVAPDGRFVVAWSSPTPDGGGLGIEARRFDFPGGGVMKVDERASGGSSNVNGILEPDERVTVDPAWRNSAPATAPLPLAGSAGNLTGPVGPAYTLHDAGADYGTIAPDATNDCFTAAANCYEITVSGSRPSAHWDATFDETLSSTGPLGSVQPLSKTWAVHVGGSFPDVPEDVFYPFIENLFHNGVTAGGGCGPGQYCGEEPVLRQQMAVFLLKAVYGGSFIPPRASGGVFEDVPASSPFAPWIEELAFEGITGGCSAPPPPLLPSFCPTAVVTRQQMAAFLLKTKWTPAQGWGCTGDVFDDVPCTGNPFDGFVEALVDQSIAAGCQTSPPLFCPTHPTKRKQMAAFLVKTFGLQLYGPD